MKYIIVCCIAMAACAAAGAIAAVLIGRILRKKGRQMPRPVSAVLAVVLALAFLCAVFFGYLGVYYHADETAEAALESGGGVAVVHGDDVWIFDGPGGRTALIFYPGAKVEAAAYAPLMRALAERGVDCFLAEMPFRMAIFGSGAASEIMAGYEYENWYIGGHSLGGTAACGYAAGHADELEGVILLASYPNGELDGGLDLLSIYGTEDGCLNREAYEAGRAYWPEFGDVGESVLPGANHAQFGSYGEQRGDGAAEMPPEEQVRLTAEQIAGFIAGH